MASERRMAYHAGVNALAAYRLTRLIIEDTFPPVAKVREKILDRYPARDDGEPWQVELIQCPWCVGFWVSAGVVMASRVMPKVWNPVAEALAFSALVGKLSEG